jgi:hypothetical protein
VILCDTGPIVAAALGDDDRHHECVAERWGLRQRSHLRDGERGLAGDGPRRGARSEPSGGGACVGPQTGRGHHHSENSGGEGDE